MAAKISVQICSYNRIDLLRKSLEALFSVDFPFTDFEVVLVDDGSTDGTEEMVRSLDPPYRLKYLRQEHKGLAAGRNLGIKSSEGEIVLFIDDDCMAHRSLLAEHLKSHEKHPKCVVLGRVRHVCDPDERRPGFKFADISFSFFWTSNVSVKKVHIEEAGLFDEGFTEYGWEDIEFGHRLRDLGLVRRANLRAIVYHCKSEWRACDLSRLCRQARSSGRSAAFYFTKRPKLRSRLSTGIFPLRFLWNDVLYTNRGFFQNMVKRAGDRPLSGLSLLSARTLMSFEYFKAVRESMPRKRR